MKKRRRTPSCLLDPVVEEVRRARAKLWRENDDDPARVTEVAREAARRLGMKPAKGFKPAHISLPKIRAKRSAA
ncbi:MAG: hypothetical protein ACKVZJ_03050 [Phycisphaerales bacterium]